MKWAMQSLSARLSEMDDDVLEVKEGLSRRPSQHVRNLDRELREMAHSDSPVQSCAAHLTVSERDCGGSIRPEAKGMKATVDLIN